MAQFHEALLLAAMSRFMNSPFLFARRTVKVSTTAMWCGSVGSRAKDRSPFPGNQNLLKIDYPHGLEVFSREKLFLCVFHFEVHDIEFQCQI